MGVCESFLGSCRVSDLRLGLGWTGEVSFSKKKVGQVSFSGLWMSLCGSPRVTKTRCGVPRTSEQHFPGRRLVTFRVVECSFCG